MDECQFDIFMQYHEKISDAQILDIFLLLIGVCILLYSIYLLKKESKLKRKIRQQLQSHIDINENSERINITLSTASILGITLWPIVWNALIGYDALIQFPATTIAFLWPIAMSTIDLLYSYHHKSDETVKEKFAQGAIKTEALAIVSIAWVVGGFVGINSKSPISKITKPLMNYALILIIAFIIPSLNINKTTSVGLLTENIQRTAFNFAIAFIIAAGTINYSASRKPYNLKSWIKYQYKTNCKK